MNRPAQEEDRKMPNTHDMPDAHDTPDSIEKSRRRWGLWLLIPLLAALAAVFVLSMEWRRSLKLRHIEVEGAHALTAQDVIALAGLTMNARLRDVDLAAVQRQIASNPTVKSAGVTRQYPDALRISIREREPFAGVSAGQMWYVDAGGVLLPFRHQALKPDLPIISGVAGLQNARAGEVLADKEIGQALEILERAQSIDSSLYHFISEVNMNHGGDITLFSVDAGVPIILGRGGVARKLFLLRTFWAGVVKAQGADKLQSIDLRFDDQVVVKWIQRADKQSLKISL